MSHSMIIDDDIDLAHAQTEFLEKPVKFTGLRKVAFDLIAKKTTRDQLTAERE